MAHRDSAKRLCAGFLVAVAWVGVTAVVGRAAGVGDDPLVGVWNFSGCAADGTVANARPDGGGVPARLMDFAPEALAGVDVAPAAFSIVRDDKTVIVEVAKSGWATFAAIPDNGLDPGVATPVGPKALAVHAANPGNWVHFPGLATALVGRPGGAVRTCGVALWVLVQTEQVGERAHFVSVNPLIRFGGLDTRFFLNHGISDRLYTEDVGNGLGGAYGYQIPWARRFAATSRWVHLAMSADGAANEFHVWVNGEPVNYREPHARCVAWPPGGGLQLTYQAGEPSDGAVMGRWLGGGAAPGRTFGLAAVVITRGEPIDQERARHLYRLGRRGQPFDGHWPAPPADPAP
ncbi:MAG: hypothetical protein ACKOC4_08325 [Planctomycetia bacterium]